MDIGLISLVLIVGIVALLAIGMPLGFASGFMAVVVLMMKFGPDFLLSSFGSGPLNILSQRMYGLATDYVLISVPLFIFMAALLEQSGIARDMYSSLNRWLNRTRGGIAVVTSLMAVVMAAMSGIIGGEIVLLGLIALPQMLRLGYDQNLAVGTICASGSLGTMIPPSIVLIIYGLVTDTSIHALFRAAFVPGFILAACYVVYILVRTRLHPEQAPLPPPNDDDPEFQTKCLYASAWVAGLAAFGALLWYYGFSDRLGSNFAAMAVIVSIAALWLYFGVGIPNVAEAWSMGNGMIAPLMVVFVVLGSIYGGITGITEAAAMGTMAVLLLIILRGEFTLALFISSLRRTFRSTGTILWITFGATMLAGAYTIAGGPVYIANFIVGSELSTWSVLLIMMVIFLFLGAFMDWVGIVLLVMPVFLPIVLKLPIADLGLLSPMVGAASFVPVWFGILFCINMQVSFLSPPFGPAAFYLKSVCPPHISLPDIFRGFMPFICIQLFILTLVLLFPELTMLLR